MAYAQFLQHFLIEAHNTHKTIQCKKPSHTTVEQALPQVLCESTALAAARIMMLIRLLGTHVNR
jgi:hypothetical protein